MNDDAKLEQQIDTLTRSNDDLIHFAHFAAHELQAPLRAVTGFLSLLQDKHASELSPEAANWLNEAMGATERMSLLIHALLTMSRIESQEVIFNIISTQRCLDDAIRNLQTEIEAKNAQITVGQLPDIRANETLLTLLFQNCYRTV